MFWSINLHGAHGADVKTEQTTSDDGDGRDEVNIADLFHCGGRCWYVNVCGSASDSRELEEVSAIGVSASRVVSGASSRM
jgi:hypothetical protein